VLYAFGFTRVAVVVGDIYSLDPAPDPGEEGAERGVRLEVRLIERGALRGDIFSAQPIEVGLPIWRADLFETVDGEPGSFDRTHHHPKFIGWSPSHRKFDPALSAAPLEFVAEQLSNLDVLVKQAELDPAEVSELDAEQLREAVPEIIDATRRLLARVHAGELAAAPDDAAELVEARIGWL
jgi:hypothetical protein